MTTRPLLVLSLHLLAVAVLAGCAAESGPAAPASAPASRPSTLPAFAASGSRGVVATVHPLAMDAGIAAMRRGGNAVDAAIAAAVTLGVVDGHNSGIGGGCFILIRRADGSVLAIDGREVAPAAATRDMFVGPGGKVLPGASTTGPLASGVPGALAAYDFALRRAGKLTLADVLRPAADLADRGFELDPNYARRLAANAADLRRFPASAAIFLDDRGRPWPAGHRLVQHDLASSYRAIADHGTGWFYSGPFAQSLEAWMKANGGILTAKDLANYRVKERPPLITTYRGYTLIGFPPPSSGGTDVAQILNILEHFDLRALDQRDPAVRLHVTAEAMKLAFADRAFWLGDPDFVRVPVAGLTGKAYAKRLAARIDLSRTIKVESHGNPEAKDEGGRLKDEEIEGPLRPAGLAPSRPLEGRAAYPLPPVLGGDASGIGGCPRVGRGEGPNVERAWRGEPLTLSLSPEYWGEGTGGQRRSADTSPSAALHPYPEKHTTHIAAADAEGNWVAITTTVNTSFGSKVVVPGTGVLLNDQMDDFSAQPGVPNAFGLVGAEANSVAPGKRPLSSMSPTIVLQGDLKTGRPILTLGAAGGPTIITQVLQTIVNHVDLGMPLPDALAAPRIHHQWQPDELAVEKALPADVGDRLRKLGHNVVVRDSIGACQAAGRAPDGATLIGVHDPRVRGKAMGE